MLRQSLITRTAALPATEAMPATDALPATGAMRARTARYLLLSGIILIRALAISLLASPAIIALAVFWRFSGQ